MIPSPQEIARQIAAMVILHPEKSTSEIASELMYPALFIINAIREGKRMELIAEDKDNDKITLVTRPFMEPYAFGEELNILQMGIHQLLANVAEDEQDMEEGQMRHWLMGTRESAIDIVLLAMEESGIIERYQLADPGDKKSVYTFICLKANAGKQWGKKQFKPVAKKKKK